ncbi:hypothetical protein M1446_03940 [Candidatus Dependentiae bacterium]|nr:hypothetical protein [Candidatus Dependentiae bacterium]
MTQSIKEFLNKNLKTFGTNRLDFELKGNEVIIENAYPVEGYDATYIISKQKLIKLIDDWFEIKKQNPDEIILSREGDEFTVTGINKEEKSSF